MNQRGQVLLLAVLILSILLLIALSFHRVNSPRIYIKRDYVQAAMLVQLARVWIQYNYCIICIRETSRLLYQLNQTYGLNIPALTNSTYRSFNLSEDSGYYNYTVVFYTQGGKYVRVTVYYNYFFRGFYLKRIGGEIVRYKNYTLQYFHKYEGPWGILFLKNLSLTDPRKQADIRYIGDGLWVVGFPADYQYYIVYDKFGIPVRVGG